jgi:hypothetical protein
MHSLAPPPKVEADPFPCYFGRVPLGSHHQEEGLLLREKGWLILRRDDGGRWRLDADARAEALLGRRVTIDGVRSGFDLLDVRRINPC